MEVFYLQVTQNVTFGARTRGSVWDQKFSNNSIEPLDNLKKQNRQPILLGLILFCQPNLAKYKNMQA